MTTQDIILSDKVTLTELRPIKESAKNHLKELHVLPKTASHLALVAIDNEETRNFVMEWLAAIGVGAVAFAEVAVMNEGQGARVQSLHSNDLYAFDFFVFDGNCDKLDVVKCMKAGIVPVMPEKNIFSGIMKPFNPMKFEGNGFFFKSESPFALFASCVSYIENSKFPEDRRILMKHVIETF